MTPGKRPSKTRLALVLGALLSCLVVGCLGGQTGQPTSGSDSCDHVRSIASDDAWEGTTPARIGRIFEGTHEASLEWLDESSGKAEPVEHEDRVFITIEYEGAAAELFGCQLDVPVTIAVETASSDILERGAGRLWLATSAEPLTAGFALATDGIALEGELKESNGDIALSGNLMPTSDAPGDRATFPVGSR